MEIEFFKNKEKNKELLILIKPLNCLSISDKVNSSYVDTNGIISDNKIYGLLENILDFHYENNIRDIIKKSSNSIKKFTDDHKKLFGYYPIIDNICDIIEKPKLNIDNSFIDFSSCLLTLKNDVRHINGSRNCDYSVIDLKLEDKLKNFNKYPKYYTGTLKRKYILTDSFIVRIKVSDELYDLLLYKNNTNKTAYLGNSESIVNINIIKLENE